MPDEDYPGPGWYRNPRRGAANRWIRSQERVWLDGMDLIQSKDSVDVLAAGCGTLYYRGDLAEAAMAASSARARSGGEGWRPIEEAPANEWLLVYEPAELVGSKLPPVSVALRRGGSEFWVTAKSTILSPTHWRPLPAAPAQGDGA